VAVFELRYRANPYVCSINHVLLVLVLGGALLSVNISNPVNQSFTACGLLVCYLVLLAWRAFCRQSSVVAWNLPQHWALWEKSRVADQLQHSENTTSCIALFLL